MFAWFTGNQYTTWPGKFNAEGTGRPIHEAVGLKKNTNFLCLNSIWDADHLLNYLALQQLHDFNYKKKKKKQVLKTKIKMKEEKKKQRNKINKME